ncbi:hypothetical protein M2427_007329 [Bradyrhizobium sp. BR13661]|nr:hypothetical protein [Bradyrhizobium sp. BR13661]
MNGHDSCTLSVCRNIRRTLPDRAPPNVYPEFVGFAPNSGLRSMERGGNRLGKFSILCELT